MPAINFPKSTYTAAEGNSAHGWASSPSNGDTDSENGRHFTFSGTRSLWVLNANSAHSVAGAATYTFDGFKWTASNIPDSSNTIFTSDTPQDGEILKFQSSNATFVFDSAQNLIQPADASTNGMMTAAQFTKLAGIETGATADQTAAEIKTAYESNADTNEFSDAEQTKLAGIAAGAEVNVDPTLAFSSSINQGTLTLSPGNDTTTIPNATNSNAGLLTGAEHAKLVGIEAGADVTDAANVDAAGAVMNSDLTVASMSFVIDEDDMATNSATRIPTQQSVKQYVDNNTISELSEDPSPQLAANLDANNKRITSLADPIGAQNAATKNYVDTEITNLIDNSPSALNTLNELAAALGDDANFSTTVTNSIATKLPLSGGTMTGNIVMSGSQTVDGRDLSVDGSKLDGIAMGANAYLNTDVDAHLNISSASSGQTLIWNGSDYSWGTPAASYGNSDVDSHLNRSSASTGQSLTWNGSDYAWATVSGTGGDAGTLDGIDSSSFFRSDQDDDAAGFGGRSNVNSSGDPGLLITNGSRLGFDQSGTRSWTIKASGGNLNVASGDGNGTLTGQINATTLDGINSPSFLRSDTADNALGNITFQDSVKAIFGVGGDLNIYHSGSNSIIETSTSSAGDFYIVSQGTNHDLYLRAADDVYIQPQSGEDGIKVIGNGSVELYHDNGLEAKTVSDGFEATNKLYVSASTNGCWLDYNTSAVTLGVHVDGGGHSDFNLSDFSPATHQAVSLGTSSKYWGNIYGTEVFVNGFSLGPSNTGANIKFKSGNSSSSDVGIALFNGGDTWGMQIYAHPSSSTYGFLASYWGSWDMRKTNNGALEIRSGGTLYPVWHNGTHNWIDSGRDITGNNITASISYASNWFRTTSANTGLYSVNNDNHFFSASGAYWHINSHANSTSGALLFYQGYNGSAGNASNRKGYVYWDSGGFGLLNSAGSWRVKCTSSGVDLAGTVTINGGSINAAQLQGATANTAYGTNTIVKRDGSGDARARYFIAGTADAVGGWFRARSGADSQISPTSVVVESSGWYYHQPVSYFMAKAATGPYWHVDTWLSFNGQHGLYYPSNNSNHLYLSGQYFQISNNANAHGWIIKTNSGTTRGYFYADSSNTIGILNNAGSWSLQVDSSGNGTFTGNVTAYSDIRIKENIRTVTNALDKVQSMRGVYFDRKDTGKASVGVIAQEIEEVLPEVVNTIDSRSQPDKTGLTDLKTVSYGNIVGVLIEAIKELRAEVAELKEAK